MGRFLFILMVLAMAAGMASAANFADDFSLQPSFARQQDDSAMASSPPGDPALVEAERQAWDSEVPKATWTGAPARAAEFDLAKSWDQNDLTVFRERKATAPILGYEFVPSVAVGMSTLHSVAVSATLSLSPDLSLTALYTRGIRQRFEQLEQHLPPMDDWREDERAFGIELGWRF